MNTFKKIFSWLFFIFGIFSFLFFILSFTDLPYYAYHNLGTGHSSLSENPDIIVVLGGSGMPSPDGLIRTYYASEAANEYQNAKIIIALPYNVDDSLYQLNLMARELIVKGIDSMRIVYEPMGTNTRTQAVNIASMLKINKEQLALLIITTPEHMYRSVKTFKKVGFTKVGGLPTFEKPIDEIKLEDANEKERINLSFRYNMWSYLNYELLVLREYCAIIYYKLKGWI
ncbi:MAG: YdcF family protein [Bacteroidetes bacterium]|nr:YdcF family protein [Bacteroidota bacterium]MBL6944056.1 YdcF family protein [Bacteroidales bacterium]